MHAIVQDEEESNDDEPVDVASFRIVKVGKTQDACNEIIAKLKVQIPGNEKQPVNLELKVERGALSNIFPQKIFSQVCPDKMTRDG